jgi:hypothetical protein
MTFEGQDGSRRLSGALLPAHKFDARLKLIGNIQ